MTPQSAKPVATGATASLVCGILAFTPAWLLSGIPAVILGHRARKAIRTQPDVLRGSSRALAGIILGYLSVLAPMTLIVLGLMLGAIPAIKLAARKTEASQTSSAVVVAISAYAAEYHHPPGTSTGDPARDEELDNLEVMDALTNVTSTANPRKVLFFDTPKLSGGMLIDPWGNRYHIAVDRDGDGKVDVIGMRVNKSVIVWSDGENGEDDRGVGDDVRSW